MTIYAPERVVEYCRIIDERIRELGALEDHDCLTRKQEGELETLREVWEKLNEIVSK